MTWDLKKELGRKAIHLFSISFLVIYFIFSTAFNEKIALMILTAILVLMIEIEFLRIEHRYRIPLISKLWKYKRAKERHRLGGEVYFLIGSIICLAIFDIRIAAAAILMTTFGDLAAALVGKRFGRTWITEKKALEGILAELIVNILIGILVIRTAVWKLTPAVPGEAIWTVIIVMAVTATVVETILDKLDDNLLIPLFAGFNGQITLMIMIYLGII